MPTGGKLILLVRARDSVFNISSKSLIVTAVPPPSVTIESAESINTLLSQDAITGKALSAAGINDVRIWIYDYAQRRWLLSNQSASYNATTGSWHTNKLMLGAQEMSSMFIYVIN